MEDNEDIRSVMHNYAKRSSDEYLEQLVYPGSPGPSPALGDFTLQTVLKEALRRLTAVEATVQENTASIRTLTVSLDRFGKKVDEAVRKTELLQSQAVQLERSQAALRAGLEQLDACKRRWNLRVLGLQERDGENVKQRIVDLFSAISPDIADQLPHGIDLARRLGARAERPRGVVVQFVARSQGEKIWRASRTCELLKQMSIQITEDLSEGDQDATGNELPPVSQVQTSFTEPQDARIEQIKEEKQEIGLMDQAVAVKVEMDDDYGDNEDEKEVSGGDDDSDEDTEDEESDDGQEDDGRGTIEFVNTPNKSEDSEEKGNKPNGNRRRLKSDARREAPHGGGLCSPLQKRKAAQAGEKKPYRCVVCGNGFVTERNLIQHHRIHTGEKPHLCSYCGKSFRHIQTLIKHRKIHTRANPHQCSQCGKSFTQSACLEIHQRVHAGEKPYSCSQCGKGFTQEKFLKNHQKVHSGTKLFTCTYCGKSFTLSGNLKNHLRIHTGEKPYRCTDCGKSFTHAATFINHHRIHTGEKPYRCPDCGKSFTHSTTLKNHQRTHTGERPYHCSLCGRSFTQLGVLREHQRSSHATPSWSAFTAQTVQVSTHKSHQ